MKKLLFATWLAMTMGGLTAQTLPYQDTSLTAEQRADDLLGRLTLDEKVKLMMEKRTNTYLPNGHNYQDGRLRCYLPGNGGLLTAIAMMCAGWDGCTEKNPGFPKNGQWNVRWEGLQPLP